MKSVLVLLLSALPIAFAVTASKCECAEVKCSGTYPEVCQCQNNAQIACASKCGGTSTIVPCPIDPPSATSTTTSTTNLPVVVKPRVPAGPMPTCECEWTICIDSWPQSCICANKAAIACYQECGGVYPKTPSCNPSGLIYSQCGGGRANYTTCDDGYVCIKDPLTSGCGPACDQYGICVENKVCGGFAGLKCPYPEQVCVDVARDGCDPENGGADCGGLCAG